MADDFKTGNHELDMMIKSHTRIDENTVQLELLGGVKMTVDNNGDRISGEAVVPWHPLKPGIRTDATNVGTSRPDASPTGLTEGVPGGKSEWNLDSLEAAQRWLRSHADYLGRLYHAMDGIKDLIEGPATVGLPAIGAFPGAKEIFAKHTGLYKSFNDGLKGYIESLYDTADALGKVATNYAAVEERNALDAAQWAKIFGEGANSTHHF